MRKNYIFISLVLIILLVGCSNRTAPLEGSVDFDEIKSQLQAIPDEYNPEDAIKDGTFVVVHGEVKSSQDIIDKFISDSQNGKQSSITVVQYTIEGDPIITKVVYDGDKYYGIEDTHRDRYGDKSYNEFQFKYLKVFDQDNIKSYYLFDDNEVTQQDLFKSLISSNSKEHINHQLISLYEY